MSTSLKTKYQNPVASCINYNDFQPNETRVFRHLRLNRACRKAGPGEGRFIQKQRDMWFFELIYTPEN